MAIKTESDRDRLLEDFKNVEDTGLSLVKLATAYANKRDALSLRLDAADLSDLNTRNNQLISALKTALSIP